MFFLSASANLLVYCLVPLFFFLCICTREKVNLQELNPIARLAPAACRRPEQGVGVTLYVQERRSVTAEEADAPYPIFRKRYALFGSSLPSVFDGSPVLHRGPPVL